MTLFAQDKTPTGFYYPQSANLGSYAAFLAAGCGTETNYTTGEFHLGKDLQGSEGAPVYAIADGQVVYKSLHGWIYGNPDAAGDGITSNVALLIKHETAAGFWFQAVYGHILTSLSAGDTVRAGDQIGSIGYWVPTHVHLGIRIPTQADAGSEDLPVHFGLADCDEWPLGVQDRWIDPIQFIQSQQPNNYLGGGSGGPAPQVTDVTPTAAPVGVNTTFTLTGSGFQPGFSGALWVNNSSFPLKPGAQTIYIDPNHVQLIVTIGTASSSAIPFGLQIINPDGQASNIYTSGLVAQPGGGGQSGSFLLSATPSAATIAPGQSATFSVSATFAGGFTGPVSSFAVSGLPSGASPSFSSASVTASGGTTILTVTTTPTTATFSGPVTISANGPGGLTAATVVQLGIEPTTSGSGNYSDMIVTKTNPNGVCSDPPAATSFFTTDANVYLYFYATTTLSDRITSDWLAPNGTVLGGGGWNAVSGQYCYVGVSLSIANLPTNELGSWQARVYDNGALQFSVPFSVAASGGGSPSLPPQITSVSPTTVPVGVDTTFTLTGSGFQPGFSGALWVSGSSFPLKPGAQTIYVDPSHVQLIVTVGNASAPATPFGLQVINPDGQASNIYSNGLIAQPGGGGNQKGTVGVSFQPNPTAATAISSCTASGGTGYYFTFLVSAGSGVGITPISLSIDGSTGWVPPNFTQHVSSGTAAQFGLQWCRGSGSSTWGVTAQDDNGNTVTGSGTLTLE